MPEKATKLEKKTKEIPSFPLVIVLVILIFAAAAYFLVLPQYESLTDSEDNLKSKKEALQAQSEQLDNIKKLIANYETLPAIEREALAKMLPQEIDEPGLFILFESLAQKNKMALLAIDISEKEPGAEFQNLGLKEVHIAVNLSGGEYDDFKNFLKDLESNLRLMDILSLNYTPEAASTVLNIRTYRME